MKLDKDALLAKIQSCGIYLKRYGTFAFIVVFLGIYGFLIIRINTLTQQEPSEAALSNNLKTKNTLKIDQQSINKILELEDQNIDVNTLFKQARDNPFTE